MLKQNVYKQPNKTTTIKSQSLFQNIDNKTF